MNVQTNGHDVIPGCVLDGHWGWHNHARMIHVAADLGFPLDDDTRALVDAYDAGNADDATETVMELMDDAERWLNEHTTDGFVWHWRDGEFFLSPMCEDGNCNDETCAHWEG